MRVTALLVTHNGARWLPQVLDALRLQARAPETIVAVDTGSTDQSVELVKAATHQEPQALGPDTHYGQAVRAALAVLPPATDDEWVWLIHDDAAADPQCLAELTAEAAKCGPQVVAVGPKLREWPSLKRLLEVGVTVTGTGRRENGLESGEYDQGQHDEVERVLAVNTAGMLIRRRVLEEFGFSAEFPLFANDLDLGWRLASRGLEVHVVPSAVMFHAEAAYRGRRDGALAAHSRRDRRASEMLVVLLNGSPRAHPLRLVRMLFGSLLRTLGFLLVRAVAEAGAEMQAIAIVYGQPKRMHALRMERQQAATAPAAEVAPLLAPWWMPWRHGLDFVVDLVRVVFSIIADAVRARWDAAAEEGPPLARVLRSPGTWLILVMTVLAIVAQHGLLFGDQLNGGALLPAPDDVGHWWAQWLRPWHWTGEGGSAAASAYTLPLALVGTLLLWSSHSVIWLIVVAVVPLSAAGAYRFLVRLDGVLPGGQTARARRGRYVAVWGAATYGLWPVLSGAQGQGRLGTLVTTLLLPWIATLVLELALADGDRRERARWRAVLLLAVVVSFAPTMAFVWAALVLLLPVLSRGRIALDRRDRLTLLVAPLVLLVPDLIGFLRAPGSLLLEAGRADFATAVPDLRHVLTGAATIGGAPVWVMAGLPVAAVIAVVRVDTRRAVARAWLVAAVAAVIAGIVAVVPIPLPGLAHPVRAWTGSNTLVEFAALIVVVTIALRGLGGAIAGLSFSWRQPLAAVAGGLALMTAVAGAFWWIGHGTSGPLHRGAVATLPAYLAELADARADQATLTVSGGPGVPGRPPVAYHANRDEVSIGDDAIYVMTSPNSAVKKALNGVLGQTPGTAAQVLADHGIAFIYAPAPVSADVAGAFDAAAGFASASAPDPGTRVWRVVPTSSLKSVPHFGNYLNPLLALAQLALLIALLVLAAPSRRTAVAS